MGFLQVPPTVENDMHVGTELSLGVSVRMDGVCVCESGDGLETCPGVCALETPLGAKQVSDRSAPDHIVSDNNYI